MDTADISHIMRPQELLETIEDASNSKADQAVDDCTYLALSQKVPPPAVEFHRVILMDVHPIH